jgi:hypothetical protein
MSTEAERQACNVTPPEQNATEGVGVTILAATTTAANAAIPKTLFHRYVDFIAEGDKIWIGFGPVGTLNVDKTRAGGATFAAGAHVQNGEPIASGQRISVRLDSKRHAQVSWQADSTNSKLIVRPSSEHTPRNGENTG